MGSSAETMFLLLGSKASLRSMAGARATFFPFILTVHARILTLHAKWKFPLHLYFKKTAVIYEANTFCTTKWCVNYFCEFCLMRWQCPKYSWLAQSFFSPFERTLAAAGHAPSKIWEVFKLTNIGEVVVREKIMINILSGLETSFPPRLTDPHSRL